MNKLDQAIFYYFNKKWSRVVFGVEFLVLLNPIPCSIPTHGAKKYSHVGIPLMVKTCKSALLCRTWSQFEALGPLNCKIELGLLNLA